MLPEFNPNSPQHLSLLLFGGMIKVDSIEMVTDNVGFVEVIKTGKNAGQLKTKKIKKDVLVKGFQLQPLSNWKTKKQGIYSTNEAVLKYINSLLNIKKEAKELITLFLKIRTLKKLISTYYDSSLIYENDLVRPQFSHVSTGTGRTSSKEPNVQNQPSNYAIVKEHFISRFPDGLLVQADYSQLEIRIQAQLSQDKNYIQDILNGVDFHLKRLAAKEHRDYEDIVNEYKSGNQEVISARSAVKGFSFARAYGAGKKRIMEQTGMDEEEIACLIEGEDALYPQLKRFNELNKLIVEKQGWYKDPWGRRYEFKKYPVTEFWLLQKGITEQYLSTQIQNYMIQGFATGTIVLIMLGKFWREKALLARNVKCNKCNIPYDYVGMVYNGSQWIAEKYCQSADPLSKPWMIDCEQCHGKGIYDKYLLVNTIHDSVMVDCKPEYLEDLKKDLTILEDVAILSRKTFNYEFNVPIKIDIKAGKNWLEC